MSEERKEFIERLKSRLDELDDTINEFEARAEEAGTKARAEYHEKLGEMRRRRKELANKLDELRAAGEVHWHKLRREAEYTWDALQHSFNYFRSHFK